MRKSRHPHLRAQGRCAYKAAQERIKAVGLLCFVGLGFCLAPPPLPPTSTHPPLPPTSTHFHRLPPTSTHPLPLTSTHLYTPTTSTHFHPPTSTHFHPLPPHPLPPPPTSTHFHAFHPPPKKIARALLCFFWALSAQQAKLLLRIHLGKMDTKSCVVTVCSSQKSRGFVAAPDMGPWARSPRPAP